MSEYDKSFILCASKANAVCTLIATRMYRLEIILSFNGIIYSNIYILHKRLHLTSCILRRHILKLNKAKEKINY